MRRLVLAAAAAVLLGGCGMRVMAPIDFTCKGKIGLTITGSFAMGAVYGGGGVDTATIQGDCGDGFIWKRTPQAGAPGSVPVEAPPASTLAPK